MQLRNYCIILYYDMIECDFKGAVYLPFIQCTQFLHIFIHPCNILDKDSLINL